METINSKFKEGGGGIANSTSKKLVLVVVNLAQNYMLVSYIISKIVVNKNIVIYYMTYNKYYYSSYWNLKDYCNSWYKQLIGHGNSSKDSWHQNNRGKCKL